MKFIGLICCFLLLFSCSDENETQGKVDVYEIRNIGLLATSEYTIGKIIELNDDKAWYKFGDRSILISCKAKVKAGIDLSQIRKDDIEVIYNKITITLPDSKILTFDMDPNTVKTEVQDINGFRMSFTQEEKNQILAQGEKAIQQQLSETTILSHAKENAKLFIENFYHELGYKHVTIKFRKPSSEEMGPR